MGVTPSREKQTLVLTQQGAVSYPVSVSPGFMEHVTKVSEAGYATSESLNIVHIQEITIEGI
jgi:hypothetical protein